MINIKFELSYRIDRIKEYFAVKKYKRLYPDYIDDNYNYGSMKHIWGIKSADDITNADTCFWTMNDMDITYDRETKKYLLGIETAYIFKDKESECAYLKELLNAFTIFMDENNYSKECDICLFMKSWGALDEKDSIEELYANFKIYVDGYCNFYGF